MALARAWVSVGSTSTPCRPSSMTSGVPPTRVARTGRPSAIASRITLDMPSRSDGATSRSAAFIRAATSERSPSSRARSSSFRSRMRAASVSCCGPPPTSSSRTCGRSAATWAKASSSRGRFLCSTRRPTKSSRVSKGASACPSGVVAVYSFRRAATASAGGSGTSTPLWTMEKRDIGSPIWRAAYSAPSRELEMMPCERWLAQCFIRH